MSKASEFGDNIRTGVQKLVEQTTMKRIEAARCPVHGQSPTNVQVTIDRSGKVSWTFGQCCEGLNKAAAVMFTGKEIP
jgi:hypothetical protein